MRYGTRVDIDGVLVVYAEINGVDVDLLDIYLKPMIDAGIPRDEAKSIQRELSKVIIRSNVSINDGQKNEQSGNSGWLCPINIDGCTKNCGSYCCGN